ncbi:MAG TPA: MerR family DNA-binding transcriptional regulator [Candidatus Omnitrophica bacterium]|nr:MerR family DNA-binding transcriptional regulator [Candidatus Omnitrophota bacterium]
MENLKGYITIKEAAAFLGVNPMTLRNWDNQGKLKSRRHPINGYRLYKKDDLKNILKTLDKRMR